MRVFVLFAALAALGLSVTSPAARAGSTSLVRKYSGHFDLEIPDDPDATRGWMKDAVIQVPDHFLICDVDVSVSIRHTAAIDLWLFLRSPAGKTMKLSISDPFLRYYEGGDYAGTVFDDEADTRVEDGMPPFMGRYRPTAPLAAFDGQDAHGLWSLQVFDAYYADRGYLESFSLNITGSLPEGAVSAPVPATGGLALLGLALLRPYRRAFIRTRKQLLLQIERAPGL